MTEDQKQRKPSTPQLDRVIDAIERGDYDEKIIELHRALAARQDVLKAQVLEQVRQVFGDDAEIVASKKFKLVPGLEGDEGTPIYQAGDDDNPFVQKAERTETAAERGKRVMQNANDGKTRAAPPPPVTSATADQIDENRVTKDPLENVKSEAGLSVSEVERRMMSGEQVVEIEHRGAIISGLSSSQIGD